VQLRISDCRRVVIWSYNKETDTIEFRHYVITVVPHGASKSVKKLLGKQIPNLGQYEDISDFIASYVLFAIEHTRVTQVTYGLCTMVID
jgi:hypothetical protein